MSDTISSPFTYVLKYVIPVMLVLGLTAMLAVRLWFGVAIFGAFLVVQLVSSAQLKRVAVDSERGFLDVSGYFVSERISCSEIVSVSQNRWLRFDPIRVKFARPTRFGECVVFIPRVSDAWLFEDHPTVMD